MCLLDLRPNEEQSDATYHKHIGYVEGGPMGGAHIEIEEIRDPLKTQAIRYVAESASYDRAVCDGFDSVGSLTHHEREPDADGKGQRRQDPPWCAAEKAEGHAVITQVREIEPRGDRDASAQGFRIRNHDSFCDLIDGESDENGKSAAN